MTSLKVLFFFLISLSCISVHSQCQLELLNNVILSGDIVEEYSCKYSSPGENGENVMWDFSNNISEMHSMIVYSSDSLGIITGNDGKALFGYSLRDDSLFHTSYETPLEQITYTQPVLVMRYPMRYGDSFQNSFDGTGKYCETHYVRVLGNVETTADATGRLILSEKDTLNNVLRIYTLKTTSVRIDMDSCRMDSDNLKQEIEERYQWYAQGHRYPIYEIVTRSFYDNMEPVFCSQYALCHLPESHCAGSDSICEDEMQLSPKDEGDDTDIFQYEVKVHGNIIDISYSLSEQANIRYVVADITGTIHRQGEHKDSNGNNYTFQINCGGLPRRQYILYLNVNGKIYSEKIILQ